MTKISSSAFPEGLVRLKIDKWRSDLCGVLVSEGNDWVILLRNVVDYVIDGFIILPKNKIIQLFQADGDQLTYDIIRASKKLKKLEIDDKLDFSSIIRKIGEKYKVIGIYDDDDSVLTVGHFCKLVGNQLIFESVSTKAKLEETESIDIFSINGMEFDSDYINSLKNYVFLGNK